jgi:hypothetical protein
MNIVSCGMGRNSIAMLIGLAEMSEPIDLILFADTGGERPDTYSYIDILSKWLAENGMPKITIVKQDITLETDCLTRKALPSIAYGYKSCSDRWKIRPQNKFLNNWQPAKDIWLQGGKITKLIGYDADEHHRTKKDYSDDKYDVWYPLVDWGWGLDECIDVIKSEGLPMPGKSSCFFCPSMREHEIRQLKVQFPELAQRAIEMERNADLTNIKGLARQWSWESLLSTDDMFEGDYSNHIEIACGCYDG